MNVVIPYKDNGPELRYCLRGIEKYIEDPQITIIGDLPGWVKNVNHIPFKDKLELRFKERNIFQKILLFDRDFLFFNDDHFLLAPFHKDTFHYWGHLNEDILQPGNLFRNTIKNTIDLFGRVKNYFRHNPMFIERERLELIKMIDWDKPFGYCVKSIYCHLNRIEGTEYPDLKIRVYCMEETIKRLIEDRPYFSTGSYSVNQAMIKVLEELYPNKSKYE